MKKILLTTQALLTSIILLSGAVYADANQNDRSAMLQVSGVVSNSGSFNCSIYLDRPAVALLSDASKLVEQGDHATTAATLRIQMTKHEGCEDLVEKGRITYKFVGQGTGNGGETEVLANQNTTVGASQGVGVGVFTDDSSPVNLNSTEILALPWGNTFLVQMVKLKNAVVKAGAVTANLTVEINRI